MATRKTSHKSATARGQYPKPRGTVTSRQEIREALAKTGRVSIPLGRGRSAIRNAIKDMKIGNVVIERQKDRFTAQVARRARKAS